MLVTAIATVESTVMILQPFIKVVLINATARLYWRVNIGAISTRAMDLPDDSTAINLEAETILLGSKLQLIKVFKEYLILDTPSPPNKVVLSFDNHLSLINMNLYSRLAISVSGISKARCIIPADEYPITRVSKKV